MISISTILLVILILLLLGAIAHLASQQKLGLLPERRAWIDCANPAHPAVHGTYLTSNLGDASHGGPRMPERSCASRKKSRWVTKWTSPGI